MYWCDQQTGSCQCSSACSSICIGMCIFALVWPIHLIFYNCQYVVDSHPSNYKLNPFRATIFLICNLKSSEIRLSRVCCVVNKLCDIIMDKWSDMWRNGCKGFETRLFKLRGCCQTRWVWQKIVIYLSCLKILWKY